MSKRKMVKLRNEVLAGLGRPVPLDPDDLFESLRAVLERMVNEAGTGQYRPVIQHLFENKRVVGINGFGKMITPNDILECITV